jgi:cell division protein FtsQ
VKPLIGVSMSRVSLQHLEDTMRTLPFIRNVVATKELPDAVRLNVVERSPVALALIGGKLKLIDEDGFVLKSNELVLESGRFPLLTGFQKMKKDSLSGLMRIDSAEVFRAVKFCKALTETRYAKLLISEVNVAKPKEMHALSANGNAKFIFGASDVKQYESKLQSFEAFWKQVIVKKGVRRFEYVDLRYDGKIFAKEM